MNKHTRLVVSVLFAVIILLAVGITRFYVDVSKRTADKGNTTEIIQKLEGDSNGNRIFEGEASLYGVVDSNDKIIIYPEWTELAFAGENYCIASKRIGGRMLTGCIDYEDNTVVPFIFRNITKHSQGNFIFYVAESDSDSSCVIYDKSFTPCFMRSWESCSIIDGKLILGNGSNKFTYTFGENGFTFVKAELSENDFTLNIDSRLMLSKLSCTMLETISARVADYLNYAFNEDEECLNRLADSVNPANFTPIFHTDDKIINKRLNGLSDVYVYSVKADNGEESYAVSLLADTTIVYISAEGVAKSITASYKAIVRFEPSGSGISAVSGEIVKPSPDYPEEELPEENTTPPQEAENINQS